MITSWQTPRARDNKQSETDEMLTASAGGYANEALQSVQGFLASDRAVQEKVDRLVNFLANSLNDEEPADSGGDIFAKEAAKQKTEQEALLKTLTGGGASVLAADSTDNQGEQPSQVGMFSDGGSKDLVADGLASKQAKQEALLKALAGGGASVLAADTTDNQGEQHSQVGMFSDGGSKDLVADGLASKQAEQEAMLKKLTGDVNMATDDQDELVEQIVEDLASAANDAPSEESLLGSEMKVQGNEQLKTESDLEELVDQVIDALANTNDNTEESALLTSEFNGEVNGGVSLKARDTTTDDMVDQVIGALANTNDDTEQGALLTPEFSSEVKEHVSFKALDTTSGDDMADQVAQYLAKGKEPTSGEEALLTSKYSSEAEGFPQLFAKESATAAEKVDQLLANFTSANTRKDPKHDQPSPKPTPMPTPTGKSRKQPADDPAPAAALALEATTASVAQQLQAPEVASLSLEQDQLPHVMFGGAFLLVAAVVLTVMTKRSRKAHPIVNQDDAYAYLLHK